VAHRDTFTGREGDVLKFVSAALPPRDAESSSGGGDYSKSQLKKWGPMMDRRGWGARQAGWDGAAERFTRELQGLRHSCTCMSVTLAESS
jgi:hypothetical protein